MRLILFLLLSSFCAKATTLNTYTLTETNGVDHPLEITCVAQAPFNSPSYRLTAPNTTETAYQQIYHKVCFQARLPHSTSPIVINSTPTPRASGSIFFAGVTPQFPAPKTALYFTATSPTCLTNNTIYYVFDNNYFLDQGFRVSATPGGSVIDCTGGGTPYGSSPSFTLTGFTCVGSTDVCTAPNHARQTGDPIACSGSHPTGLTCDGATTYYVIRASADTFKWATTYANAQAGTPIDVGDLATGLNQLVTNWTWTLETGTPTAVAINPLSVDLSNPTYITVDNTLTALRVRKFGLGTPYRISNATLTSCVGNGTTMDCGGMTGASTTMPTGSTVCISGRDEPQGRYTIASNPSSTSIRVASGRNSTYNNSLLAVTPGDCSIDPVMGFRLHNGSWVGDNIATSYLVHGPQNGTQIIIAPDPAHPTQYASENQTYSVKFLERGPLVVVLQATYTGYKPSLLDGNNNPITGSVEDALGTYTRTLTMYANSKSYLDKIEGNQNLSSRHDVYTNWPGSKPNRITNRAFNVPGGDANHSCGATGPIPISNVSGSNPITIDTTPYPHGTTTGGPWTATITGVNGKTGANGSFTATPLNQYQYTIPVTDAASFTSSPNAKMTGVFTSSGENSLYHLTKAIDYGQNVDVNAGCDSVTRPPMGIYSTHDSGGIQQCVYYDGGAGTDPAICIFPGRASVQVNSINSDTGWESTTGPLLNLYQNFNPCPGCSSNSVFDSTIVRETGVCSGCTIADILPNGRPQDPNLYMVETNWLTGVGLTSLYSYGFTFSGSPTFPYMDDDSAAAIRTLYQNDSTFRTFMDTSSGNAGIPTLATWLADNSASIDSNVLIPLLLINQATSDCLTNGDGIFGFYCNSVYANINLGFLFNQVTDALANPKVTAAQTILLKAILITACNTVLDPLYAPPGFNNLGNGLTANQVAGIIASQQKCISGIPTNVYTTQAQKDDIRSVLITLVNTVLNSYGSCLSSFHYCGADFGNLAFVLLSEIKLNALDLDIFPRLKLYLQWVADQMTPPDPRFGLVRVNPPVGDGPPQITEYPMLIGSAYKNSDSTTAQLGRALFDCQSTTTHGPISSFFGSGITAEDTAITNPGCDSLARHTNTYPGWFSVLRSRYGSVMKENFITLVNGYFYSDHKHSDAGAVYAFLLGVPWIDDPELDRNGFTSGAYLHAAMVMDGALGFTWTSAMDATTMSDQTQSQLFGASTPTEVADFTNASYMQTVITAQDGTVWTRNVTLISDDADYPVLWFHDVLSGTSATSAKIFTFPLNYDGSAVTTPAGDVTPTPSTIDCQGNGVVGGGSAVTVPSGLPSYTVKSKAYSIYGAGGNGIDTDIILSRANSSDQVALMDMRHACVAGTTTYDLFFRVRTTGGLDATMLSHVKSGSPSAAPTSITGGRQLVNGSNTTTYGDNFITFTDTSKKILRELTSSSATGFNLTLTGGAQALTMTTSTAGSWIGSGLQAGTRCFDLSAFGGTWYISGPVTNPTTNKFCRYIGNAAQPQTNTLTLSTTSGVRIRPELSWNASASSPTSLQISFDGVSVGKAPCTAGVCTLTNLLLPSGTYAITLQPLDSSNNPIGTIGYESRTF